MVGVFGIRDDIPSRLLTDKVQDGDECFFVEINIRKKSGYYVVPVTLVKNS